MTSLIDKFLNKITMYRLVLYYLIFLLAVAAIFGGMGILPYNPLFIVFDTLVLVVASVLINNLFARIWKTQANSESAYITALILALIITPVAPSQWDGIAFLLLAATAAMASKYIFAIEKKHLFNPAALAVAITAFTINQSASWWIGGNIPMMAFVIIGGLLITRKIQRFDLVFTFFTAAAVSIMATVSAGDPISTLQKAALHTPIFFFAFIMLTEPLTTPPTRSLRILYSILVGVLYAPAIHFGPIYSTPELALVAGNVFSYAVSPKKKYLLSLKERRGEGTGTYDFVFDGPKGFSFRPGQYLEWTLGHENTDTRGNRRYFTIASSPTENEIHLGVKFHNPSSSFKKTMLAMRPGDTILAGQLAGDFVLPHDQNKKLVFIAGGIGITPFRSMVKYIIDRKEKRDTVLLYSNRTAAEIAYKDVFDEAERKIGMRTIYAVTGQGETLPGPNGRTGRINAEFIRREIPDCKERTFYISGTNTMVDAFTSTLRELGIPRTQIRTDFFPGF